MDSKQLFLQKNENFRFQIRQKHLQNEFSTKRNKFSYVSTISSNISPITTTIQLFHELLTSKNNSNIKIDDILTRIREFFTSDHINIKFEEIIGLLEDFLIFLSDFQFLRDSKLISELYWIIGQLCSGDKRFTEFFMKGKEKFIGKTCEIIGIFYDKDEVLVMIFFTLGNIIGTDISHRKFILKQGILPKVFDIFKQKRSVTLIQEITWFLSVFLHNKPFLSIKKTERIYPILVYTIFLEEPSIISHSLWSLIPFFQVFDSDFLNNSHFLLDRIIFLLKSDEYHDNMDILAPGLQIIGILLSQEDKIANILVIKGVLDVLYLIYDIKPLKSLVCWCIGNLFSCKSNETLTRIAHHKIINKAIETLQTGLLNEQRELLYGLVQCIKNMRLDLIRELFIKGLNGALEGVLGSNDKKIRLLGLKIVWKLGKRGDEVYTDDGVNEMIGRMERGFSIGKILDGIYEEAEEGEVQKVCLKILDKFYF